LAKFCEKHPGIGECIEPESLPALIDGIERVLNWSTPNYIASDYARKNLSKDVILTDFIRHLKS
jgi:colanic acid biosynthesis glycosyl transferase WcaI